MSDDAALLKKIDDAAEAVNASEKIIATAQADHAPKCKALGLALLELKQRYPAVKDFEAKLKECRHVKLATAYDYMKLVGGRDFAGRTDEEIRQAEQERREAAKLRKRKSRAIPKPEPEPAAPKAEPEVSVTLVRSQKDQQEIPTDERRQAMADLATTAELTPEERSDDALARWKNACVDYCNEMTEADLKNARVYFMERRWRRKQKKAA